MVKRLVMAACVAAITGGAIADAQSKGETSGLEQRVLQYWARRRAKDLPGAYPFYCRQYRSKVSRDQFIQLTRLNRFDMNDLKVAGIAPQDDAFAVTITYRYMAPMISDKPLEGRSPELWKRDADGAWCKVDEPTALPFPKGR